MRKITKKIAGIVLSLGMVAGLAGCGASDGAGSNTAKESGVSGMISVVSREDGSGTRGAFVELTGVEEKDANGDKTDNTTTDAIVANSTDVVMNNVSGDSNAIGYVSLGSLNDSVKAVKVDGVGPSTETIKDGSYKIARPFNIAIQKDSKLSDAAQDFYNYIMSAEGQQIIEDNKYIKVDESAQAFESNHAKGRVVVAGSSSVTPVMEKLQEAYQKVNGDVTVEVQQSDSTTGMTSAMEGTCDIGMASRELSDDEAEKLDGVAIAMDGIAVVVNKENTVDDLTMDQIKGIFTGEITDWSLE
ncbi:MAG: extracellular solute-binding protein [Eubacteriales bacterium]|nr:extracellular solute-binding protein [Eubacteriales bacterium]